MEQSLWFDSWDSLLKILISSLVGYVILIFFVRTAGKRSTSKMNNFDWIVTVAVGSVLASMAILKDVTVCDGALAMALLLGSQYLLTSATTRWSWAQRLFLAPPTVLYAHGRYHEKQMLKQRVWEMEVVSAVRESGLGSMKDVQAVILEPDAEFSVVKSGEHGPFDTVESLPTYRELVGNPT